MAKPRAWRTYYWYRPQSLAELGRLHDSDIRRQEEAYRRWLVSSGRVAVSDENVAEEQERCESQIAFCRERMEAVRKLRFQRGRRTLREISGELDALYARSGDMKRLQAAAGEAAARRYCDAMSRDTVLSEEVEREANVRQEEAFGYGVVVRTVRCFTASAYSLYGWGTPPHRSEPVLGWHRRARKGEGRTVYRVLVDGRERDAFLSKGPAKEMAKRIVADRQREAVHECPREVAA